MKRLHENYRKFELTPFVYLDAEISTRTTEEGATEWEVPEFKFKDKGADGKPISAEDAWAPIHEIYNPGDNIGEQKNSPYYEMIEKYVNEVLSGTSDADKFEKNRWLTDSISNFRPVYIEAHRQFFNTAGELKLKFETQLTNITDQTKRDLDKLKPIIDKKKKAVDAGDKISGKKESDKPSESLESGENLAIKQKFASYIKSQNDYYLNVSVQEARLSHLGIFARRKLLRNYKKNAELFGAGMMRKSMARLDYHLSQKSSTPETLGKYKKSIELEYKQFAGLDKNKGFIDIGDFEKMEFYANPNFNLMNSIQKSSKRQDYLYMESMYLLKYEVWQQKTETTRKMLIVDCYNNGTELAFITKINEYREKTGDKPVSTFEEAKLHFKTLVDSRMKIGVTATHNLFTDFRNTAYGKRLETIKKYKPEALQMMVFREREFLISRRLVPITEHDLLIVEFMSTNRKGREAILKTRKAELFKAIKNIKYHYPREKAYKKLAKKGSDLRYQPNLAKRPTRDDRAARLYALVTLASEAEGVVQNYSTTDKYKGQDLKDQLEKIKHDKNAPQMGLQFEDALKSKTSPYVSALSRGGFNGRDLGIKALKILGVVTFLANVANSVKTAQGKDIFEKTANALGSIATNPGVYIGAGVAGAAHMVEMHPRTIDYPFGSAHEKLDIATGVKMKGIRKQVGPACLESFLQRGAPLDNNSPLSKEWFVMDKISSRKIEKLVDRANKKPDARFGPIIENKDIEKLIPKDQRQTVLSGLNRTKGNARARFLFYEKFLYGRKQNIQQLRNVCTD